MSKQFYITTPIYYVNDKPHIGHAYTTLVADVLARRHRQQGEAVFFLTGTDEHGAKVQASAAKAGLAPLQFAEQNAAYFKQAWSNLDISYDYFIRTSDPKHESVVRDLLKKVFANGYISKGEYEGLYCVGCEKFLQEDDLVKGRCPYHPQTEPAPEKETNYFFKLSAFGDKLLQALADKSYEIVPATRKNEVVGKIKKGLQDVSISRAGVSWGVKVPWDEAQTVYVWVDALINYYSATQFTSEGKNFWPPQVHLMAKDILWFHAVVWPALLLAADLPLPAQVAAHGFFTVRGQKMSKSLGNVIDPNDLVKELGVDAARYLLLSQIPFNSDGDISLGRFRERYQSDLANGLGNTFSRVTNMIEKFGQGRFKPSQGVNQFTSIIASATASALRNFQFDSALLAILSAVSSIDEDIERTKPWQMTKAGQGGDIAPLLDKWGTMLLDVAWYLKPFMPATAEKMEHILRVEKISKAEPLFPRLEIRN